jgi:hypothetical protein
VDYWVSALSTLSARIGGSVMRTPMALIDAQAAPVRAVLTRTIHGVS